MAVPVGSGHRLCDPRQAAEGLAVPSETLVVNSDGSIDILFGPSEPGEKSNWIRTVPGKGFFPMFRFYGPGEPFFDKTWKLEDVIAVK